MKFEVLIPVFPGYAHTEVFAEVAESLVYGLRRLGHEADVHRRPFEVFGVSPGCVGIILGANLIAQRHGAVRYPGAILYNLEQIDENVSETSIWFSPAYRQMLELHPTWDYSLKNIAALQMAAISTQALVPIGGAQELDRIRPAPVKDIDVLFYGSYCARRWDILNDLEERGLKVTHLFGSYGKERDQYIARSKVVLNLHYYDAKVFEAVRVSYLLNNGVAVVSERGSDRELERAYEDAVAFAEYEEIVDRCVALVSDDAERDRLGQAGRDLMRRMPVEEGLRTALAMMKVQSAPKEAPPLPYFNYCRPEVVERFDPQGKNILDVGCAGGAMGALMIEKGARTVVGLDDDDHALVFAHKRLTAAHHVDLDGDWDIPYPKEHFDVVTCADILEHLREPELALAKLSVYLKPGGQLVCSVPNVRNTSVLLPLLLHGRFDYQEQGVLDRTHLRFFTLSTFLELLDRAGFEVQGSVGGVDIKSDPVTDTIIASLKKVVEAVRGSVENFEKELLAVQYIIVAKKRAP